MTRIKPQDCPDAHLHTPMPDGYLSWHERAAEMAKTHRQRRCRTCNRLVIWTPKGKEPHDPQ